MNSFDVTFILWSFWFTFQLILQVFVVSLLFWQWLTTKPECWASKSHLCCPEWQQLLGKCQKSNLLRQRCVWKSTLLTVSSGLSSVSQIGKWRQEIEAFWSHLCCLSFTQRSVETTTDSQGNGDKLPGCRSDTELCSIQHLTAVCFSFLWTTRSRM